MAMDKEIKGKWLDALKGIGKKKYRYLRNYLTREEATDAPSYCGCALGVLLDILSGDPKFAADLQWTAESCTYKGVETLSACLPSNLLEELGMTGTEQVRVYRQNDHSGLRSGDDAYPLLLIHYIETAL